MKIDMTIRNMRFLADYRYDELTPKQLKQVKTHETEQVGQFCKDGYTHHALFKTCLGLVYCSSYNEYCDIQHKL